MKTARALSLLALVLTVAPPALFAASALGEGPMKATMLVGTILWFATAPRWLGGSAD